MRRWCAADVVTKATVEWAELREEQIDQEAVVAAKSRDLEFLAGVHRDGVRFGPVRNISGTFKTHRDAIKGMSKAMESMGYYLVLVFFAALFIASFGQSGFGALLAVKGARFLHSIDAPPAVTIAGIILLTAMVNLLVGSASAKWAMLSPIFVPMLMILGFSPEFTQAAYRVGDSTTNIITPMMPYFPLVVVFCQRYVKSAGVGTVTSIMLPYSITFLVLWSAFLFLYWQLGLPLGINSGRLRIHRASRSGPLMNHSCKRVRPQAIRGRLCRFGQGPEPKIPV